MVRDGAGPTRNVPNDQSDLGMSAVSASIFKTARDELVSLGN